MELLKLKMKTKVLFKSFTTTIGGVERVQSEYINFLVKKGYDVKIIIEKDFGPKNTLEKEINAPITYLFGYKSMMQFNKIRDARKTNILKKIDYNIELLKYKRVINEKIKQIISEFEPDIFIDFCNYSINEEYLKSLNNTIKLCWVHTSITKWLNSSMKIKRFTKHLKKYDLIISVSKESELSLKKSSPYLSSKSTFLYNPINIDKIRALANAKFSSEEQPLINTKYLLMAARLDKLSKDFETLIIAYKIALSKGYNGKLYIIGDGDHRSEIQEFINREKLNEKVLLLGNKSNPFQWMKKCDKFILSSKYEGFGMVLVEALALNCNVISSNCESGPKEILKDGEVGHLFNVGDYEELSKLILTSNVKDSVLIEKRVSSFNTENIMYQFEKILSNYNKEK